MFDSSTHTVAAVDPEVWSSIQAENERQEQHIELIASENYASPAVMAAQGSQLTNKYAEGYPGKRYYGGCEFVDQVEELALARVKRLFDAELAEPLRAEIAQGDREKEQDVEHADGGDEFPIVPGFEAGADGDLGDDRGDTAQEGYDEDIDQGEFGQADGVVGETERDQVDEA